MIQSAGGSPSARARARLRRDETAWRRRNAGSLKITKIGARPVEADDAEVANDLHATESPAPSAAKEAAEVGAPRASEPAVPSITAASPPSSTLPVSSSAANPSAGACAACERAYGRRSETLVPLDRTDSLSPKVCPSCWQSCDALAAQAGRIRPTVAELAELRRQRTDAR